MKFCKYPLALLAFSIPVLAILYFFKNYLFVNTKSPATHTSSQNEKEIYSFSLEKAPTASLKGEIASLANDVYWQSRIATQASLISERRPIQQGEMLKTGPDSNVIFTFNNVCEVTMSQNTTLDIIQTLPVNIVFKQNDGSVKYTNIGNSSVSVRSQNLLTDVYGKVEITNSIVKGTQYTSVDVISGEAIIAYNDLQFVSHQLKIPSEKTYTFNQRTRKGVLK